MLRYDVRQAIMGNFWGKVYKGTVTSMSTNNIRSDDFTAYPNTTFADSQLFVYSGTAINQTRVVSTFTQTNGEFAPSSAFSPQAVAGDLFEVHYAGGPLLADYNAAIARAYLDARDWYLTDLINETLTMEEKRHEYPIPSGFRYLSGVWQDLLAPVTYWKSREYNAESGLYTGATTRVKLSQAFQCDEDSWINSVRLFLRKIGTISTALTITLTIETNTSGLPSGTQVAKASTTLTTDSVPGAIRLIDFAFTDFVFLAKNTTYHIIISISGSADATNYIAWGRDDSSDYGDGNAGQYNGTSWSAITDAAFIFAIGNAAPDANFEPIPLGDWSVMPSDKTVWVRNPVEGRTLRLIGQGQATALAADTSTIVPNEEFIIARATQYVLQQFARGPQMDVEGMLTRAAWFKQVANELKVDMAIQPRPNSRIVELR